MGSSHRTGSLLRMYFTAMEGLNCSRGIKYIYLFIVVLSLGQSFNVDLRTKKVYSGPSDSMFGFSITQHKQRRDYWILVGAPNAQTTQPGVDKGGAVYKCSVSRTGKCELIPFDTTGAGTGWNGTHYAPTESKTGQWFGASVTSAGPDGLIAACAPRYVYFTRFQDKREPVGNCFFGNLEFNDYEPFSPCKSVADSYAEKNKVNHHKQGSCQAGFSIVMTDGQYMAVGAVGSWYWQGQLIIRDTKDELNYFETVESNEKDLDNSYLGFSMALGEFDGDNNPDYAVGRPKWNLTGKVLLFTGQTIQIPEDSIVGEQFGEYFGYSVVADDFNNDGFDDVAAGAPFYTDYSADAYENGRVYVFYQAHTHSFNETERTILSGNVKYNARFGLALGKIGDVNQDGYNDLAVGAPYDGPDGKGAVYIFHGSKKGILKKVSQIILAADLKAGLSTFGYSLAGGYDMDGNLYPDIAVGAYESNQAVYLKSRPIVKVIVRQVLQPEMVDLTASDCQISSTVAVPCMNIETHISYEGKGTPHSIDLEVKWELDADTGRRPKRAFFYDYGTNTETRELTVDRGSPVRLLFRSYIKNDIRDKLTPIVVKVSYTLMDPVFIRPNALLPVLDQYTPQNVTSEAHIKKNCGKDNICIPDLIVTGSGEPRYHVFGKEEVLSLSVVIENLREDAFEAQAFIVIPEGVSYSNVRNESAVRPITCQPTEDEEDEQRLIICELGNPMTSGERISFIIDFGSDNMTASATSLDFHIHVNSTNEEDPDDLFNNQHLVQIPLRVETRIRLSGVSKPEQILYNYTFNNNVQTEEEAGPQVIHLYEVRTFGPSDIQELDLQIYWPVFLGNQDQHLLYLTEVPKVIQGQGECRASFVNPLNITIIPENSQVAKVEEIYEAFSQFRQRRDVSEDKTKTVDCKKGLGSCTVIRCTLYNMLTWNQNKDNALIQIRSRLWTKTLIEVDFPSAGIVSSAVAQVMKTPYTVKPDVYPVDTVKVSTSTVPLRPYRSKEPIKVWVIAVSIAGGCILLLLLIALLWRCGFFKRHRPGIQKATLVKKQNGHANGTTCEKYKYDSIANDHF